MLPRDHFFSAPTIETIETLKAFVKKLKDSGLIIVPNKNKDNEAKENLSCLNHVTRSMFGQLAYECDQIQLHYRGLDDKIYQINVMKLFTKDLDRYIGMDNLLFKATIESKIQEHCHVTLHSRVTSAEEYNALHGIGHIEALCVSDNSKLKPVKP